MKTCSKCKEIKPLDQFFKRSDSKSGRQSHCKVCRMKTQKAWQQNNLDKYTEYTRTWRKKNKEKFRTYQRKYIYGITEEQFNLAYLLQGGECATCQDEPEVLSVDHNHSSGKFRGLLCNNCNSALGLVKENIETLQSMIDYLRSNE